jgi:hypothetical protein
MPLLEWQLFLMPKFVFLMVGGCHTVSQIIHVYDLIDADGNIQGQPGYLNEVVCPGDKLLYVDSVPTIGLSFYSVRGALDGPLGSHVTLTLERSSDGRLYEVGGLLSWFGPAVVHPDAPGTAFCR